MATTTATTRRTLRLRTEIRSTECALTSIPVSKRRRANLRLLTKSKRTLARQRLRTTNLRHVALDRLPNSLNLTQEPLSLTHRVSSITHHLIQRRIRRRMIHLTRLVRLSDDSGHGVALSLERAHVEPLGRQVINRVLDRLLSVLVRLLTSQTHLLDTSSSSVSHGLEIVVDGCNIRLALSRIRVHRRTIGLHRLIHLLQSTVESSGRICR